MAGSFNIRPYSDADAEAVVALYARAATVDARLGPVPIANWARFTKLPHNKGCRDFRVAERQGQLVGLAESSLKEQGPSKARFFKLVVDPAARRQKIGSALLKNLLAIAGSPDELPLQTLVKQEWHAGHSFLTQLGFSHIESEIGMKCARLSPPARCAAVMGATFERASDYAHLTADIARIHNAAYASDVSFSQVSPEEMLHGLEGEELWIVPQAGAVLGFCCLKPETDRVWLEVRRNRSDCPKSGAWSKPNLSCSERARD